MSDYNFDLGSFEDLAAVDMGNLADMDFGNLDLGGLDLGNIGDIDLGSLADLGNIGDIDLGDIDLGDIDFGGGGGDLDLPKDYFDRDIGGLDIGGTDFGSQADLGSFEDIAAVDQDNNFEDLIQKLSAEGDGATRSLIDLSEGAKTGGVGLGRSNTKNFGDLGLTSTGRGQISMRDPETGATGITGEGFTSLKDLLGSGTAEEIARYTPGSMDYSLRSGLETEGGQGLSSDATRGMGLKNMGGGQGLSLYKPAEYGSSVLEDLVNRMDPKYTGEIQDYINDEIFGGKGLTPFKGTGGTLSQAGFLNQSSKQNPLGAQYAIGDPKSFINNPAVTGQQATVSPGKTVINNQDGTIKTVTDGKDGTKTVTKKDDGTKTSGGGGGGGVSETSGLGSILPLLLMMLMMNQNRGGGGSNTTIPALTASQKQTPYTQQQRAPGYRPGQGGITYFDQTQYAPKMAAGGGIGGLLNGPGDGVSDSIPAVIDGGMAGGGQPAKVARGEYIFDARSVAALGNGSTDAGAERLDKMRENILRDDRKAGVGEDSKAYRHLMA
jgi:hypothetical protein